MARDAATRKDGPTSVVSELTVRAVLLGCLLGLLMTAANAYLGLYAGMTVSASIPAAVISMGILRGLLRRGTILENNIVQTIASAGESLAAGVIFTVPALVITGAWDEYRFWPITGIAVFGGMLGVLFMIPLRRALIVEEEELAYPEGTACAEVLRTGESGGSGVALVFGALAVGAILKLLGTGMHLFFESLEWAIRVGKSAFYVGSNVSPALIAVGYIVGFNVSALVFLGGAISWLAGIPLYYQLHGYPDSAGTVIEIMNETWHSEIRFLGVGAMVVGGIWSIIGVRRGIVRGIEGALAGYRSGRHGDCRERTDRDMALPAIAVMLLLTAILVSVLYIMLIGSLKFGLVAAVTMLVASFFFVAVASYIVGLVGSSNSPVSGMTISALLFASLLLLAFGMTGHAGIIATLGVAGVVCCATCTAGDTSQDLKTGFLVGASPYKQQWAQVIGVVTSSVVIAPTLWVLHHSYGIGIEVKPGVKFLQAPQANLFARITETLFGAKGSMPWGMVWSGIVVGAVLIVLDEVLRRRGCRFRTYVMPVAVGIYLPWSLSTAIFLGGLAAALTRRTAGPGRAEGAFHRGVLAGSGLIAGEAIMGIVLAIVIIAKIPLPTVEISGPAKGIIAALVLAAIVIGIVAVAVMGAARKSPDGS